LKRTGLHKNGGNVNNYIHLTYTKGFEIYRHAYKTLSEKSFTCSYRKMV